jgi:PadR family transcriptional regulator PadR
MVAPSGVPTLSSKELTILSLLESRQPMFGLELVAAAKGELKRGTVYVTLNRMEEKGYLESEPDTPRPGAVGLPRRMYRPTALGLRVLSAWTMVRAELSWEATK